MLRGVDDCEFVADDGAIAAAAAEDDDGDIDPTKHMCIYCARQFTFLRALRRHVVDGCCSVRRDLVERQEYLDDEWETELKAAAGVGRSSTGGSADVAGDDAAAGDAAAADGSRRSGGKRRRRCMNWGSGKSKSRRSARSSGDDADDSLFGWEDAYLSTWGKDEREDITGGQRQQRRGRTADDDATTTALAQLLTSDITINVSDRQTRTSSDDIGSLVAAPRSTSSAATDPQPAATGVNSVVTTTTTTTSSSGMSFAVKLELLTGSHDNDDRSSTSPHVADGQSERQVTDVVLVVDEILKHDDDAEEDAGGGAPLDTSSSGVSDCIAAGPAVEISAADKDAPPNAGDSEPAAHLPDDVSGDDVTATATEHSDDVEQRLKARRRPRRRLTMTKRKK